MAAAMIISNTMFFPVSHTQNGYDVEKREYTKNSIHVGLFKMRNDML